MIVSTKAIILTYWRSVQTPSTGLDRTLTSFIPRGCGREVAEVAAMLKAIHAQEDRAAARQKAEQVAAKLREMKLADAATIVTAGIEETLYYYAFPREHWRCLRTNNPLERLLREVRRTDASSGGIPGRQVSPDAGRGQIASCSRHEVGHAALPGHEPSDGGERSGMSARETNFGSPSGGAEHHNHQTYDSTKCAKSSGHYRPTLVQAGAHKLLHFTLSRHSRGKHD